MGVLKTVNPQGMGAGRFMIGENEPMISNEEVTMAANAAALPAGTVLGMITATKIFVPLAPAAADGSQNFAGLLYADQDISAVARKVTVVARKQVVNRNLLNYANAVTNPQKAAVEAQMVAALVVPR